MLYGAHVYSAGGISTAIDRAEELGCDAVQIFTQSPRMWKPTEHSEEEVARFRARREEAGVRVVVCHALYLVNLAGADREMHKKSVTAMQASLETAREIGADGVVYHVGSHLDKGLAAGYRRAVPALRRLLELTDERLWLVLENSAGAGGTMGRSVDELEQPAECRHRAAVAGGEPLPEVRADVEHDPVRADRARRLQRRLHRRDGLLVHVPVGPRQVDEVERVTDDRAHARLLATCAEPCDLLLGVLGGLPHPRALREDLDCVAAELLGPVDRRRDPAGRGDVGAVEHGGTLPRRGDPLS